MTIQQQEKAGGIGALQVELEAALDGQNPGRAIATIFARTLAEHPLTQQEENSLNHLYNCEVLADYIAAKQSGRIV